MCIFGVFVCEPSLFWRVDVKSLQFSCLDSRCKAARLMAENPLSARFSRFLFGWDLVSIPAVVTTPLESIV